MLFSNRYEQAVKFINTLVPKKTSLQILSAVKINQKKASITYESTDLDNFLRVHLPVWSDIEGEFVIDSKFLMKAPKKIATTISGDKISFGNISVTSQNIKEFPSLETCFFNNPVWEQSFFPRHELIDAGKRLCNYTSTDEVRGVLKGIGFRSGYLYATNGQYLLRYKTGLKAKKGLCFVISPIFFKLLSNEFVLDDGIDLSVYYPEKDNGYIIAQGNSFELVSKLIPDEYPVIEKILPPEMPHTFLVEREPFMNAAKQASMYANQVTSLAVITLQKNETEFKIAVKNIDSGAEFLETVNVRKMSEKNWDGLALNAKSLSVILSDCPGKYVLFKAGENKLSAVTVEPEKNTGLLFLLMPLRTIEEEEPEKETDQVKSQVPVTDTISDKH